MWLAIRLQLSLFELSLPAITWLRTTQLCTTTQNKTNAEHCGASLSEYMQVLNVHGAVACACHQNVSLHDGELRTQTQITPEKVMTTLIIDFVHLIMKQSGR